MIEPSAALALLRAYEGPQRDERALMIETVTASAHFWRRDHFPRHLTASAWITDATDARVVLLHHAKLDLWVQPGGHLEAGDDGLLAAARREVAEETGLVDLPLAQSGVFDLDVHAIPARGEEPEHWHLDVRFWFRANGEALRLSDESRALRWVPLEEVAGLGTDESVLRMLRQSAA